MTVPASKVKSICTSAETALVRASRKGQIEQLSAAELKRHAARAKGLSDKWRDLERGQSRTRSRQDGFGDSAANTALKAQIFREAMEAFEAQAAKAAAAGTPGKTAKPKAKRDRTAEHRTTRAAIRKGMTAVEDLLNTPAPQKKAAKVAAKPTAASRPKPAPVAAAESTAKPAKAKKGVRPAPKPVTAKKPAKLSGINAAQQRRAKTVAKQTRVALSGKTTRIAGHALARGQRNQARRDSKG